MAQSCINGAKECDGCMECRTRFGIKHVIGTYERSRSEEYYDQDQDFDYYK